ncbi:TetR/AcrR family transcriptional regulator [Acinetobacter gerneri]|uniref:TetR/AcrR family transcriptional regulator n=1 Tax=Acinetobacter gerneri TaxID=202952 RepID=A0AAW8JI63_9GAMM|nr:TetR/AcrR family transcriptional regulator [Acinetobacter gerneri]MDQ9010754.1 TetR/AcrR family transcriptional regulator [Acinetobacter gerneri]MDQ9014420.1 TetR/AcrR family transcriptional regulator [Acinetobacter gerneri]MDQ9025591.1 TetR/AcrR family transcriptional regulator [Acinetobacter gerneri]MDQ9052872.1 TetR/AcrR family transcriptional regulator [Acinetobacter gerneri]MDQ9060525.1 TetR/AcrR family transcriptional regulator [Acinetobacter gerneri]
MKQPTIQVRRKPQQSRAKMTQDALIDTFVRLLNEKTANAITIREMTDIAGIGLGTFYEYFSKKDDLIALMIHQHVKNNAETLKTYAQSQTQLSTKLSFQDYLAQVIHFQILQVEAQQHLWAQTFLLERQISSIEIYQKSYVMMVQMWRSILVPYIDNETALQRLSLNVQRICYGFISQTLLIEPEFAEWEVLEEDILLALKGLHL